MKEQAGLLSGFSVLVDGDMPLSGRTILWRAKLFIGHVAIAVYVTFSQSVFPNKSLFLPFLYMPITCLVDSLTCTRA